MIEKNLINRMNMLKRIHNYLFKVFIVSTILISCKEQRPSEHKIFLKSGSWKASLMMQDQKELPFLFEVFDDQTLKIFNAEETITVDEIRIKEDSIFINFPVFEGYVAAKFEDSTIFSGIFIKESLERIVPFKATFGAKDRF